MACASCSTGKDGKPGGCKSNGGCSSGGCNRLNTYDWLSVMDIYEPEAFDIVEVSFKNGSRKTFYKNPTHTRAITGDNVVVEATSGHDVGTITLSGELVRLQMKRKKFKLEKVVHSVLRRANERDMEKLFEARSQEKYTMIRARAISRSLGLEMKIGDVEYQGDKRKATFYYTAEGRVDFRELIRHFAKEFRIKVEMRQIGARQESARIGGLGSCGRELCCSTWLTDFKSVSTGAARYQNLAINQSKLSGQCGRLKCCLNFELDTYMEAIEKFPKHADKLHTQSGTANLIKTDIFKRLMFYIMPSKERGGNKFFTLSVDRVFEILEMNKNGEKPIDLVGFQEFAGVEEPEVDFDENLTGVIELPPEKRRSRNSKRRNNRNRSNRSGAPKGKPNEKKPESKPGEVKKKPANKSRRRPNKSRNRNNNNRSRNGNDNKGNNNSKDKSPKKD